MKGLFLDNFYKTIGSIKLFAFLVFAVGVAALLTGNDTILELFVYIAITALSVNGISSMRKDADVKWNKLELTLPVRRSDIVKSKYLSYLFWVLTGIVIAAIFTALAVAIHGNVFFAYGFRDISSLFTLGTGIALLVGALFYPLAYLLGIDKSETLLVISVIGGVGLAVFLIWMVNLNGTLSYYTRLGIFALIIALIFCISYLFTKIIYRGKEF